MKTCPKCNHENKDTSKFCDQCGTKLPDAPKYCPECGTKLNAASKFCPECGHKIGGGVTTANDTANQAVPKAGNNIPPKKTHKPSPYFKAYTARVSKSHGLKIDKAIEYGDMKTVKLLLSKGVRKIDDITFGELANVHNAEMLEFLIEQGADIFKTDGSENSNKDLLFEIIRHYHSALYDYGHDNHIPERDVFNSEQDINNKYLGIIQVLLDYGFDIEEPVNESVRYAIRCTLPELVFFLVEEYGADVSSPALLMSICSNEPSERGLKICKFLIKHGANVNYTEYEDAFVDDGITIIEPSQHSPLTNAMDAMNIPIIELLLKNGAEITDYIRNDLIERDEVYGNENAATLRRLFGI